MLSGKCCLSDRDYLRVQHPIEKGARPSRAAAAAVLALSLLSSDLSFFSLISLSHSSLPVLTSTASQLLSSYFFFFFPPRDKFAWEGTTQRSGTERNGLPSQGRAGSVGMSRQGQQPYIKSRIDNSFTLRVQYSFAMAACVELPTLCPEKQGYAPSREEEK